MTTATDVAAKALDIATELAHQLATLAAQGVQIGLAAMQVNAILILTRFGMVAIIGGILLHRASVSFSKSKTIGRGDYSCDDAQGWGIAQSMVGGLMTGVGFIGLMAGPWVTAINPAYGLALTIIDKLLQ